MDWEFTNFIVQVAIGIGTVGMTILIFYLEIWRKPRFLIEFEQREPFCRKADLRANKEWNIVFPVYWIRIRVKNDGTKAAKNCEGKLVEITQIREGKEFPFQPFDPVLLHWVGYPDIRPIDINRKEYEYLDVIYTVESGEAPYQKEMEGKAILNTDASERGIKKSLPVGEYVLTITIYGENVEPLSKRYHLIWNGKWDEIKVQQI